MPSDDPIILNPPPKKLGSLEDYPRGWRRWWAWLKHRLAP